jgi:hypothetical protein
MPSITYKSLSSLAPIRLKYQYYKEEPLKTTYNKFLNGLECYNLFGTSMYQDFSLNKNTCLILTSALNLTTFFNIPQKNNKLPFSVVIQPRNSTIYYLKHNNNTNTFQLTLTSASAFYIQPILNTTKSKIYVDTKPLQVQNFYPYEVFLGEETIDENVFKYQQFEVTQQDDIILIRGYTNDGLRYLSINNDNILRATGLVFNESIVNDYIFKGLLINPSNIQSGFIPTNNWVTYYFDIESKKDNKTVTINKNFENVETNFLIDFAYLKAIETGSGIINIANLKTGLTPTGGPAPIENSYTKEVITTN